MSTDQDNWADLPVLCTQRTLQRLPMFRGGANLVFGLLLGLVGCDDHVSTTSQNVLNGAVDTSDPVNNAIVTIGIPAAICTGTLITARHVLTAAHCTQNWGSASRATPISAVGFGPVGAAPVLTRRFIGCVRHPNYYFNQVPVTSNCTPVPTVTPTDAGMPTNQSGILSRHDVAILTLESPVPREIARPMGVELLNRPRVNWQGQIASISGYSPFTRPNGVVIMGLGAALS